MLKVGLTGGIGSGKSLICDAFRHLGVPVFNADNESKFIINSDANVIAKLKIEFGDDIYENDKINKPKLASLIFNDDEALKKVNSILHPKVREYFLKWCTIHKKAPYVIEEAAILFESNAYKELDITINVHADELIRINRVVKRDNTNPDLVKDRIKNQLSDKDRIKLADFTINNNGNEMVLPQILEIHKNILNRVK